MRRRIPKPIVMEFEVDRPLTRAYLHGYVICPECNQVMRVGDDGSSVSCCDRTYKRPTVLLEEIP